MISKRSSLYKCHRFSPTIIQHVVWLYHRFNLSNRDIEDLVAERGIGVSYESIRLWCTKFGPKYARRLRRRRQGYGDTFNRALEIVRRILYLARDDWEWIMRVPKIRMLKEPRRRVRFLKHMEADRLIEALPEHLGPVVQFALATGCRMREILRLEWNRVDIDRQVSWLDHGSAKTGEGRGIPLNNDALMALRDVDGQHEHWCFTYRGRPMEKVGSAWRRALKRAGIEDFRFHDLRHTWASWHVMSGTGLTELME